MRSLSYVLHNIANEFSFSNYFATISSSSSLSLWSDNNKKLKLWHFAFSPIKNMISRTF